MALAAITFAARRIAGIMDVSYLAQSAFAEGNVAVHGNNDTEVILPSAANVGGIAGVCLAGGQTSTTATSGSDFVPVQWLGRAKCTLPLSSAATFNRGGLAVVNDSSGNVTQRTKWTTSAGVLGTFSQTKTAGGAGNDFIQVDLAPYFMELCMPVTGFCQTAPGSTTIYLAAPTSGAGMTSQVPLYVAPAAQTLRNLTVAAASAPGGSNTVIFTVLISTNQGTSWTATSMTATLSSSAVSNSDTTHTPALAANAWVAIACSATGTAASGLLATFQVT